MHSHYTLIRSARKTLAIQVTPDLEVIVRAPLRMPKWRIERILKEKEPWIEKHLASMRARNAEYEAMLNRSRETGDGAEQFGSGTIDGAERTGEEAGDGAEQTGSGAWPAALFPLNADDIRRLTAQAKAHIPGRVAHFAEIVGVSYGRITIRNQKTRWGSCSEAGNLNFNCQLMLMPSEIIDYVVVHELCHRRQMNHSSAFWNEVGKVLPDYKERRAWLKKQRIR